MEVMNGRGMRREDVDSNWMPRLGKARADSMTCQRLSQLQGSFRHHPEDTHPMSYSY